jgi:hypothetical protein
MAKSKNFVTFSEFQEFAKAQNIHSVTEFQAFRKANPSFAQGEKSIPSNPQVAYNTSWAVLLGKTPRTTYGKNFVTVDEFKQFLAEKSIKTSTEFVKFYHTAETRPTFAEKDIPSNPTHTLKTNWKSLLSA